MRTVPGWRILQKSRHRPGEGGSQVLVLILGLHLLTVVAVAQEGANEVQVGSDGEILATAEADLELLHSTQSLPNGVIVARRADAQLRSILQRHPNSVFRFQVEEDLAAVGELLAEHNLLIAKIYSQRGHGLKGARGRLLQIVKDYQRYSKMDEVLFLLADLSMRDENPDESAAYLGKILSNYPLSGYFKQAWEKLNQIEIERLQTLSNSNPEQPQEN
jgi:hypothetical protein